MVGVTLLFEPFRFRCSELNFRNGFDWFCVGVVKVCWLCCCKFGFRFSGLRWPEFVLLVRCLFVCLFVWCQLVLLICGFAGVN